MDETRGRCDEKKCGWNEDDIRMKWIENLEGGDYKIKL